MSRAVLAIACLIGSSTALSATTNGSGALGVKAKRIIADRLVDPQSLSIRATHVSTTTVDGKQVTLLCGEYNSKNRLGGFVGFKPFVYEATLMRGVLTLGDSYEYDFFSETGSGDFIQSQTDQEMEAAAAAGRLDAVTAELQAANHRYGNFAVKYFPVCLGQS